MVKESAQQKHLDKIFALTYEELRRLASSVKRGSFVDTYNPTALVNEAYLKLCKTKNLESSSQLHFKRIAARAMRQVLVDAIRQRMAHKRGNAAPQITLNDQLHGGARFENFLKFDEELQALQQLHKRQGLLVELHFFGGYTIAEAAEILEISEATAWRDYRTAKSWLKAHIQKF